jgi:hypothetical protein
MIPEELLQTMKTLLEFNDKDTTNLKAMGPLLTPYAGAMAQLFYGALDRVPEAKAILDAEPERRNRLHATLDVWYKEIFSGNYGNAYAERRWIIGLVHVKVGIPPKFVVASVENVYLFSARKLSEVQDLLSSSLEENCISLSKLLRIDLAFIEQSYAQSTSRAMALEIGASEALFKRFASKGAEDLLAEARAGKF